MLIPPILALATATMCWPIRPAVARLATLRPGHTCRTRRPTVPRPRPVLVVGAAALLAAITSGIGLAIAVAVGGATAYAQWRVRVRAKRALAATSAMSDAIHGLVAELRSGAHPMAAAESTARDAREPAASALTLVATTARLGGDLPAALTTFANRNPILTPILRPLTHAWSLAQRHGLPLADVLDAVRRDIAGRVRFAHQLTARMAGPRASGAILAALPLLGVALGEGMGAHPVHILLGTSLGQSLLAAGTILICIGTWWITKLTTRAEAV